MKRCVIVDDSEVVARSLEHFKFEPSEAQSGHDALDLCTKCMPDAILLDSHIPPMAPVEFLSSLRALLNGSKPVIYCATENDPTDIANALRAGADDYLLKPFDRESLRAKFASSSLI